MNIIALKGAAGRGKTTTIRLLYKMLEANNYEIEATSYREEKGDFRAVFKINGKLIGIVSSGDSREIVDSNLKYLIEKQNCTYCICACRISGGTIEAIEKYTQYTIEYISKSVKDGTEQRLNANQQDAHILFNRLHELV